MKREQMKKPMPICAREGCDKPIKRLGNRYCSVRCSNLAEPRITPRGAKRPYSKRSRWTKDQEDKKRKKKKALFIKYLSEGKYTWWKCFTMAGYSRASSEASKNMMNDPEVIVALEEGLRKHDVDAAEVIAGIKRISVDPNASNRDKLAALKHLGDLIGITEQNKEELEIELPDSIGAGSIKIRSRK